MKNYISKLEIRNFRSCIKTSINFNNNLSTLIGINGSGKSNFLNGIMLLKKMINIPYYSSDEEFSLSTCKINGSFVIENKELPFKAVIDYVTNDHNFDQVINATQSWNFLEFTGINKFIEIPINNIRSLRNLGQLTLFDKKPKELSDNEWKSFISESYYASITSKYSIDRKNFKMFFGILEKISEFLQQISYYSASQFTDPSRCPTYFEIDIEKRTPRFLSRNRTEHQRFMADLYSTFKNNDRKFKEYLSIIGIEGLSLVDTIVYNEIEVPSNEYEVSVGGTVISKESRKVLVIPHFVIGKKKLSPNQLSEGTFKTLAIIYYLITDSSNLLILEEPEVCIHHGLLLSLIELIKEFSNEKQIILSTHSDIVLDKLNPVNVFIVKIDPIKGTSIRHVPKSMSDREYKVLKQYLLETGNLGEYWRHGDLEK
jgi:AAA15 family ATPase/GTPase